METKAAISSTLQRSFRASLSLLKKSEDSSQHKRHSIDDEDSHSSVQDRWGSQFKKVAIPLPIQKREDAGKQVQKRANADRVSGLPYGCSDRRTTISKSRVHRMGIS